MYILGLLVLFLLQVLCRKPSTDGHRIVRPSNGTSSFYRTIPKSLKSCSCLVCGNSSSNKNICITTLSRVDGMGSQAVYLLDVLSYVFHRGWQFCGLTQFFEAHGVQHAYRFYDFLFGDHHHIDMFSQLKIRCDGGNISSHCSFIDVNESNVSELESMNVTTPTVIRWNSQGWMLKRYYDDSRFVTFIRRGALCGIFRSLMHSNLFHHPDMFRHSEKRRDIVAYPLIVTAHLRLGDAFIDPYRFPVFDLYRQVFQLVQQLQPTAEFHIFTSLEPRFPFNETFILQHFIGMNISVHIDEESSLSATSDVTRAIAHMAVADVLLTARSSFSYLAGLLNPNCVIYQPFYAHYYRPLPNWIELPDNSSDADVIANTILTQLPNCLSKL